MSSIDKSKIPFGCDLIVANKYDHPFYQPSGTRYFSRIDDTVLTIRLDKPNIINQTFFTSNT